MLPFFDNHFGSFAVHDSARSRLIKQQSAEFFMLFSAKFRLLCLVFPLDIFHAGSFFDKFIIGF